MSSAARLTGCEDDGECSIAVSIAQRQQQEDTGGQCDLVQCRDQADHRIADTEIAGDLGYDRVYIIRVRDQQSANDCQRVFRGDGQVVVFPGRRVVVHIAAQDAFDCVSLSARGTGSLKVCVT